ncbi:MAG: carbon storage regulator [Ferrimicrobium acidiphilum]
MLVLRRRAQDTIDIITEEGAHIVITVTEIGRNWVKLGFDAPSGVDIQRDPRKASRGE